MEDLSSEIFNRAGVKPEALGVNDVTRPDLVALAALQTRKAMIEREEAELVAKLLATGVTGIRGIVAGVLGVSTETLRVRYPSGRRAA